MSKYCYESQNYETNRLLKTISLKVKIMSLKVISI